MDYLTQINKATTRLGIKTIAYLLVNDMTLSIKKREQISQALVMKYDSLSC